MYFPNRLSISKNAATKFQTIKNHTGLTPNILARIAIMLAINSKAVISPTCLEDGSGKELSKDVLFGDHIDTYEILIRQYLHDMKCDFSVGHAISALVEVGVHKMGHVRSLDELASLK